MVLKRSWTLLPSFALVSKKSAFEFLANASPVALDTLREREREEEERGG